MGKPAARVGDQHICPEVEKSTNTPHVGGEIKGPGVKTVLIGGKPAAVTGDACICAGEPNVITGGSTGVLIGGKPAAREGDSCGHGGVITGGCMSVLIGERGGALREDSELFKKEKEIIDQALKDCVAMLEEKYELLKNGNFKTLEDFNKWFGSIEVEAVQLILKRIQNVLDVCKILTVANFKKNENEINRKSEYALVYPKDKSYRIFLTSEFWKLSAKGKRSRPGILIHELSHFKKIGKTVDDAYGEKDCMLLAKDYSEDALKNADSFEFFIEE